MEFHQSCELHLCVYFLWCLKKRLEFQLTSSATQNIERMKVLEKYVSLRVFK